MESLSVIFLLEGIQRNQAKLRYTGPLPKEPFPQNNPGPLGSRKLSGPTIDPTAVSVLVQTNPGKQHGRALSEEPAAQGFRSVTRKPWLIVQVILIVRMLCWFKTWGICEFINTLSCVHSMASTVLKEPRLCGAHEERMRYGWEMCPSTVKPACCETFEVDRGASEDA